MKRQLLIILAIFLFAEVAAYSQTGRITPTGAISPAAAIWGMTYDGGDSNVGIIFKMNLNGSGFKKVYSFRISTGYRPTGGVLVKASNNLFYGLCTAGGAKSLGCLFSFNPSSNVYKDIIDFNGHANGQNPEGNLTLARNGKLYGVTSEGGQYNFGILFSFDPSTNVLSDLLDFSTITIGIKPMCTLLQGMDGKLYGTTTNYGESNKGIIFSFDPTNNTFNLLHDNSGMNRPAGALMQASNGLIYGTEYGSIFSFNPITKIKTPIIMHGDEIVGIYLVQLNKNLVQNTSGKIYGFQNGNNSDSGQIFSIDPAHGNTYTTLMLFDGINKGKGPMGGPVLNPANQTIYGVTFKGGASNKGVIFSYSFSGVFTKLHDFTDGSGGSGPIGNLWLTDINLGTHEAIKSE